MAVALDLLDEVSASVGGPRSPWFFPSDGEYRSLLEGAGFDVARGFVRLTPQRRRMPSWESLVGFLRSQAFVGYKKQLRAKAWEEFCARAEKRASTNLRRPDGSFDLDFVRLDCLVWP
jgi:hypothetical protein